MKKHFAQLIFTLGGQTHYSGHTRTMYVYGLPPDVVISETTGKLFPFKIKLEHGTW